MASYELNIKAMSLADLEEAVASLHERFQGAAVAIPAPDGAAAGEGARTPPARRRRAAGGAGGLLGDVSAAALADAAGAAQPGGEAADGQREGGVGGAADGGGDGGTVGSTEAAQEGADQAQGPAAGAAEAAQAEEGAQGGAEAPADAPPAEVEAPALDLDAVRSAAKALAAAKGVAAVQAVLGAIRVGEAQGVAKFNEIPTEAFGKVVAVLNRAATETLTPAQLAEALA